ncbi:HEAT repeat domain-containing protein [Actinoplanes sp. NPDC026619]|uniref:HEAT repeat domain-containing protein n=1 Tax=Actinoplanes sp. NPDC026619 TaxID=3155798 RepID=UPI0033EC6D1B
MFAGLDDLDWAAMRHAYGSAGEVPDLLRGLVDPDPAVREVALDSMHGAVHHQGDIYDSTAAAVPFLLEALRTPGRPGRDGIAAFLASVVESCGWTETAVRPEPARTALRLIEEAAPALLALVADPDPLVRAAVSPLLAMHRDGIGVLIERAATETDPEVRKAMLEGLGRSADPAVAEHLIGVAARSPIASVSVAALTAAAHIIPELVPTDGITGLLKRAYAEHSEPAHPAGFATDTLIGAVRVRREQADQGRRNPAVARSIDSFARLLGPRVPERIAILTELLRDPHPDVVGDAIFGAGHLIERWRGDYRELVELVAGHLPDPWAERGLHHWVPLCAPAADALAACVARGDGLQRHRSGPPSLTPALAALIGLGDERAFAPLAAIVEGPDRPSDAVQSLRAFPQHAERIVELLLASDVEPDQMVVALGVCGAAARPAVPRILSAPLKGWTARALGRIGGAEAMDALRAGLRGADVPVAVAAAGALWRLESDPEAITVLGAHLEAPSALNELAEIGPAAEKLLPDLRSMMGFPDKRHWTSVNAAICVWRIGGDAEAVTPALVAGWRHNERTRTPIAEQAAGVPALAPLCEAELAEVRRAGTDEYSFSSSQVADDEKLVNACGAALIRNP